MRRRFSPCFSVRTILIAWIVALAGLLAGCYSPNPIIEIRVAPNGARAAVLREDGRLGVTALDRPDRLHLVSRAARMGISWSPGSGQLAWVEHPADEPMALCVAEGDRPWSRRVLLRDANFKGSPVWLTNGTIAFLSDRESQHVNVWTFGLARREEIKLIDAAGEVRGVCASPAGGLLAYECDDDEGGGLYVWNAKTDRPLRLSHGFSEGEEKRPVSFSPNGRWLVYGDSGDTTHALVLRELATSQARTLPMGVPVENVAVWDDGGVAARVGTQISWWQPTRDQLIGEKRREIQFDGGVPIGPIQAWGRRGVVCAINQNLLCMAPDLARLGKGQLNAQRDEDWIALASAEHRLGRDRAAHAILKTLATRIDNSQAGLLADLALARFERERGHPGRAIRHLEYAVERPGIAADLVEQIDAERVALIFFEQREPREAVALARADRKGSSETEAGELGRWIAGLAPTHSSPECAAWQRAGAATRAGHHRQAAHALVPLFNANSISTGTLNGLGLLLGNGFEPLGQADGADQAHITGMLRQPLFQRALLFAAEYLAAHVQGAAGAKAKLSRGETPDAADLLGLLLQQWSDQGNLDAARELVRRDLRRGGGPLLNYADILEQTLTVEENAGWVRVLAGKVLFAPEVSDLLAKQLTSPQDALMLRLARVKADLIAGKRVDGAEIASGLRSVELNQLAPAAREQARCLLPLLGAKAFEAQGQYENALPLYQDALAGLSPALEKWEEIAPELVKQIAVIRIGSSHREALASYLRVERGMGDALLSPSREADTLRIAATNFKTLLRYESEPAMQPFIWADLGIVASMGGQKQAALGYLRRAKRGAQLSPFLMQRILLEEAAVRDALDQHALAARLYGRIIAARELPDAVRVAAILAQTQAQRAAGEISDFRAELRRKAAAEEGHCAKIWLDWLRLQAGE